jgi:hypothetical protein
MRCEPSGLPKGVIIEYVFSTKPTPKSELDAALTALLDAKVAFIFTAGTPTGVAAHRVSRCASR